MQAIFTPAARFEILDAQDWYETQQAGLGVRFRGQLEITLSRMHENPYQFPAVFHDVHRARLRKFPDSLFFCIETEFMVVIACFHGSRDPQRWQQRV
ncbi:MAG: type II toxin-antitoxin system RelE/ParE family toxin [Terriglobales bacterium]